MCGTAAAPAKIHGAIVRILSDFCAGTPMFQCGKQITFCENFDEVCDRLERNGSCATGGSTISKRFGTSLAGIISGHRKRSATVRSIHFTKLCAKSHQETSSFRMQAARSRDSESHRHIVTPLPGLMNSATLVTFGTNLVGELTSISIGSRRRCGPQTI